jgi:hypothetical protein
MNDDAPELPKSSGSPEAWPPEFWKLVEGASDEPISSADAAAFAEQLANDPAAQRQYLAHIQLQADIRLLHRAQQSLEKALTRLGERVSEPQRSEKAIPAPVDFSDDSPLSPSDAADRSLWSYFSRPPIMGLGIAFALAIVVGLIVTSGIWTGVKPEEAPLQPPIAQQPTPPQPDLKQPDLQLPETKQPESQPPAEQVAKKPPKPDLNPGFIARVVQSSDDLVWDKSVESFDFLMRIKPRQRLNVVSGFVQIEFFSGAKFILRGPTVFMPLGRASGRIESGQLTGEVSRGHFRLKTPTAEVIDLGTAFGVATDAKRGTDVVVFDGRVLVHAEPGANGEQAVLDMTEGMAARFLSDGTMESGLKTDLATFTRTIPANAPNVRRDEICLIDVVAGGSGMESYLAGSIAPFNGQRDYSPEGNEWMQMSHLSDGKFYGVPDCPLLNGVFIPKADGQQVQIDSTGRKVDLPPNSGYVFGTLWARRKESIHELKSGPAFDFWGFRTLEGIVEKLKTTQIGLVGMHANMGVTFDLEAMQTVHHRSPVEFRGAVSNIENFAEWPPGESPSNPKTRLLDCRILVDGEVRYSRLGFRREDGDEGFAVKLTSKDRFLTIVMTDSDTEFRYDHGVLIDPVIVLNKE